MTNKKQMYVVIPNDKKINIQFGPYDSKVEAIEAKDRIEDMKYRVVPYNEVGKNEENATK